MADITPQSEKLKLERIGHTALVTLNNPPTNIWDEESLITLAAVVESLNQDDDIYALVITGHGSMFFSTGADLNLLAEADKEQARHIALLFGHAFERLRDFRGVSIAAINGFAIGGGLECALACDIRVAETQAQMALPEASVGLIPCGGGTQHLTRLVGEGWAKRMLLLEERWDAATAERIGLVEEVVPQGKALARALSLAAKAARQSPAAVQACKQLIQAACHGPMSAALSKERDCFVNLFGSVDQREGVNAFLEKREPQWKNC